MVPVNHFGLDSRYVSLDRVVSMILSYNSDTNLLYDTNRTKVSLSASGSCIVRAHALALIPPLKLRASFYETRVMEAEVKMCNSGRFSGRLRISRENKT